MKRIHILSVLPVLALCASACGFLDSLGSAEMVEEETSGVYHVTIPVEMKDLPSVFKTTDKIYLYNETQDVLACDQFGDPTVLHPEDINDTGTQCVLQGQVTFYKYSFETERRTLVKVDKDDYYRLIYNLSEVDTEDPEGSVFDYNGQDGSAASALAHFYAETSRIKMNNPAYPARFFGLQSMLDMTLTFRRDGATVSPALTKIVVSAGDALGGTLHAVTGEIRPDRLTVTNPPASDLHLSLAFDPESDYERIFFLAQDTEGNFYETAVQFPYGGFMPGAAYSCEALFEYTMSLEAPEVSRSDGGSESQLTPNADNTYAISPKGGKIAITITGGCTGYNFVLTGKSTVTLAGGGTANYPFEGCFLATLFYDMTVVLDSDYTIKCPVWGSAIMADAANLKFSTTGGTHKLTLVYEADENLDTKGLKAQNYSAFSTQDPADLAAKGFSVALSDEKDNGDGTRTCVYTVAPAN